MKIVINKCFGGFSLSPIATQALAKRKGKDCFFFQHNFGDDSYTQITLEEANHSFMWFAYSVNNPADYKLQEPDSDGLYRNANKRAEKIVISDHDVDRSDPDLVAVVEELGDEANGMCAQLKVVEIPDGIAWEINEYDGLESVHEQHSSWS